MQDAKNKKPQMKPKTVIIIFSIIILLIVIQHFIVQTLNFNLIIAFVAIFCTIMSALTIYFWYIGRKALENKGNLSAWWLLYKKTLPWVLVALFIFSFIGFVRFYYTVKFIDKALNQPNNPYYRTSSDISDDCLSVIKYKELPEDKINACNFSTRNYWGKENTDQFSDPYYGKQIKEIIIRYGPPTNCSEICKYQEASVTIWPDGKITDSQ